MRRPGQTTRSSAGDWSGQKPPGQARDEISVSTVLRKIVITFSFLIGIGNMTCRLNNPSS